MIWVVPGVTKTNGVCKRPVDYMNIYPTLNDLCSLAAPDNPDGQKLEGVSMRALLENPNANWSRPALTTYGPNNHALRSHRYRYIRYADGSEELYSHESDPMEFINQAQNEFLASEKRRLAKWFPKVNVPEAPRDAKLKKRKKSKK